MKQSSKIDEFCCYICDISIGSNDKLETHLNIHKHDEFFECPDCADIFLDLELCKEHVEQHVIPVVSKAFTSNKLFLKEDLQVGAISCTKTNIDSTNQQSPFYDKTHTVIKSYDPITAHTTMNCFESGCNYDLKGQSKIEVIRKAMPETCDQSYGSSSERKNLNIEANSHDMAWTENENMHSSHKGGNIMYKNTNTSNTINVDDVWGCQELDANCLLKNNILRNVSPENELSDNKLIGNQSNSGFYTFCKNNLEDFSCNRCSKIFKHNYLLQMHLKRHANDKNAQCEFCGREFLNTVYLKMHMLTHTRERPYQCKLCSKNYRRRSNLTEHERTHIGPKEVCYVCGKLFANNDGLRKHLQFHSGEKPYKCEICEGRFSQKKHLENHLVVHTKEKKFICNNCGNRFGRKDVMEAHKRHHCKGMVKIVEKFIETTS